MANIEFEDVVVRCKRCGGSGVDPVKAKTWSRVNGVRVSEEEDQNCTACGGGGSTIETHRKR